MIRLEDLNEFISAYQQDVSDKASTQALASPVNVLEPQKNGQSDQAEVEKLEQQA
jgi:hypothetical protein